MRVSQLGLSAFFAIQLLSLHQVLCQHQGRTSASDAGQSSVTVNSGRGLAKALAKHDVVEIVLSSSITLDDTDWIGLGALPLMVRRSVTIRGKVTAGATDALHVLDANYAKSKIFLEDGVSLTLESLILTRFSEQAPLPTLSLDLVAPFRPGAEAVPAPGPVDVKSYVWLLHAAINVRICLPQQLDQMALLSLPRPAIWPGTQNCTGDLDQTGCSDDVAAPWLRQCWPARRQYKDVAGLTAILRPTGLSSMADYAMRLVDTDLLCSAVMPLECIQQLGPVRCFHSFFPDVTDAPPPPPPFQVAHSRPPPPLPPFGVAYSRPPPPPPPPSSSHRRSPPPRRQAPPPWWRRKRPSPKLILNGKEEQQH